MANNQYVNKVQYDGNTLIDLTSDTVVANKLAQGYTAHDASGAIITGTLDEGDTGGKVYQDQDGYIVLSDEAWDGMPTLQSVSKSYTPSETAQSETVTYDSSTYDGLSQVSISVGAISPDYVGSGVTQRSSSDLTASGATVTAPAGYYASQATKSVSSMTLPTSASSTSSGTSKATIGRSTSDQYINIPTGYNDTASYYKVSAVANGSATTPATSITANPTISVGSDGLITASVSGSKSVTPTVSAGYVSSGTAGTVSVSGSNTSQLSTQAAATISPTESEQTAVAAGKYTTGIVKVGAISSTYVGSGITSRSSSDLTASGATVSVPAGYYASNASKAVASGSLGQYSWSNSKTSTNFIMTASYPNFSAGYISSASDVVRNFTLQEETVTPSTSQQVVQPSTANHFLNKVTVNAMLSGTAGTPTATKGTVSNHSVSVTPSVTNTTGYITGSTKTGTAVTVTASELASGNKAITENGTGIDVVGYSTVSVAVESGGYTCTVSGTGATNCYVQKNQTGTKYYTDGDTFLFSSTDSLYFNCNGTRGGGDIYLNGVRVAADQTAATYTLSSLNCDVSVAITYSASSEMYITMPITPTGNIAITENTPSGSTLNVANYATATVNVAPTYTCTVSGTGNSTYCWVLKNGAGTKYYTDGNTFTFEDGDYLYIRCRGTSSGCTITVNGTTVASATGSNYVYYTMPDPRCDVTVEMTYSTTSNVNLSIPSTSIGTITADSLQPVGAYAYVTSEGLSPTDLQNYLRRNTASFTNLAYWPAGLTFIGDYAFAGCGYFDPPSLPNTVTTIGGYAFYGCGNMALASLPSGVTSIGSYAFQNCTALALTSLPSGLTTISQYAFYGCANLALTSLPSGVTAIENQAFNRCSKLALTSLPNGVTTIGDYAFYNCTKLALTSLPSGLTTVSMYAFYSCKSIAAMTIPNGVTQINASAFELCTSLASLSLPSSITLIGNNAFGRCTSLASVSCEGAITTLGSGSFRSSSSDYEMQLVSASFPNLAVSSLTTVFGYSTATNADNNLEFADIGNTSAIAANAFANCYALETLVIRKTGSICTLSSTSAFTNTPMSGYNSLTGTVYVPSALISTYQTATNWKTLYNGGTLTFAAIEGSDYDLS